MKGDPWPSSAQELNLLLPDSQLGKAGVYGLALSSHVIPSGLDFSPAKTTVSSWDAKVVADLPHVNLELNLPCLPAGKAEPACSSGWVGRSKR